MSSKVTKFMGNGNVKKGKKTKRKVGDKNVDPTMISKQNLSPSKKLKMNADEPKDLFCDICKVEFNEISKKEKHMAVLHKSQMTKVEKKSVPTKAKEPNNKPKEFHPCSSCQERFDSKNKLKKHLQIIHPKRPAKSKQGRNCDHGFAGFKRQEPRRERSRSRSSSPKLSPKRFRSQIPDDETTKVNNYDNMTESIKIKTEPVRAEQEDKEDSHDTSSISAITKATSSGQVIHGPQPGMQQAGPPGGHQPGDLTRPHTEAQKQAIMRKFLKVHNSPKKGGKTKEMRAIWRKHWRDKIVSECVDHYWSPRDLEKKYGYSADTIRQWVKEAVRVLPNTYKKTERDRD